MDRASDSGSEGWGFESLPVYHSKTAFPGVGGSSAWEGCLSSAGKEASRSGASQPVNRWLITMAKVNSRSRAELPLLRVLAVLSSSVRVGRPPYA